MEEASRKGNIFFLSLEGIRELSARNHGKAPENMDETQAEALIKEMSDEQLAAAFRSGRRLLDLMAQRQLDETGSLQPQALCEQSVWTDKLLNEMELRNLLPEGNSVKAPRSSPLRAK